jgi:hypothetical protein
LRPKIWSDLGKKVTPERLYPKICVIRRWDSGAFLWSKRAGSSPIIRRSTVAPDRDYALSCRRDLLSRLCARLWHSNTPRRFRQEPAAADPRGLDVLVTFFARGATARWSTTLPDAATAGWALRGADLGKSPPVLIQKGHKYSGEQVRNQLFNAVQRARPEVRFMLI